VKWSSMEEYGIAHDLSCLPLQNRYRLCGFPLGKKYRSHFEIIALMVEAVKDEGRARFSIMKHASINCGQLNKFLGSLIEMGFIYEGVKDGRVVYRASERGLDFLRQYYVLLGMLLAAENGTRRPTLVYEPQLTHK
jgi:predicted transcriptional regulator